MANIKLILNPINITNHIVVVVEAVNNLGVEVTRQSFAPPHTQRNTSWADLEPILYRFFFWESSDGVALDTLLSSADIDASIAFDAIFEIFELTVGGPGTYDPADGTNEIEIPELDTVFYVPFGVALPVDTQTGYMQVFQRGVGPKITGEIENFSPTAGRGFRLLNGDLFYAGDVWVINVIKKVLATPAASSTQFPEDVLALPDASTVISSTHYNKALELTYNGGLVQILQIDTTAIPDKKYFTINTHSFPGNYAEIQFTGGSLKYQGSSLTSFWMAAGEELVFIVKGGVAKVIVYHGNAGVRGRSVLDYKTRTGYLQADGTEYNKADVPGLYAFVESLPPGVACSFVDWALSSADDMGRTIYLNKSRWAIDAGTEKIKVPDLRSTFWRALALAADTERTANVPGGAQQERVGKFKAIQTGQKGWSYTGAPNNTLIGNGDPNHQETKDYLIATFTPKKADNVTNTPETRPFNVGLIPLITL